MGRFRSYRPTAAERPLFRIRCPEADRPFAASFGHSAPTALPLRSVGITLVSQNLDSAPNRAESLQPTGSFLDFSADVRAIALQRSGDRSPSAPPFEGRKNSGVAPRAGRGGFDRHRTGAAPHGEGAEKRQAEVTCGERVCASTRRANRPPLRQAETARLRDNIFKARLMPFRG